MSIRKILNSKRVVITLFLLPAAFFFLLYLVVPIPVSGYYSLFKWDGIGTLNFIQLDNWKRLLSDDVFWLAVGNNFKLVIISIIGQIPIALILAVLLTRKLSGVNFFKTVFFIPMLISSVAVAFLWRYMYDPTFGLINAMLEGIGLESWALSWLGDTGVVFYSIAIAVCWRFIPLYMIIFMAAISGISEQLYEAARIDGASPFQSFWKITLPLLLPTMINAVVLVIVGSLKYFGMVYALSGGGPNHASEVMATYMYTKSFTELRMGYGSTISLSLFLIAFVVSVFFLALTKRSIRD